MSLTAYSSIFSLRFFTHHLVSVLCLSQRLPQPETRQQSFVSADLMAHRYTILTGGEIRLISLFPGNFRDPLRCDIAQIAFSSSHGVQAAPSYEALSYVWGDQIAREVISVVKCEGNVEETLTIGETWLRLFAT